MAIRRARFIKILLATTTIGFAGLEVGANLSATSTVTRMLARHRDIHVGGVWAEPLSGRLVLSRVTGTVGGAQISIGSLTLPLPATDLGLVTSAQASPFDDKPDAKEEPDEPEGKVQLKSPDAAPAAPAPTAATPAPTPAPTAAPAPAPATKPTVTAAAGGAVAENVVITQGGTTYRIKRIEFTGTTLSAGDIAAMLDPTSADNAEARLRKLTAATISIPDVVADETSSGTEVHMTTQSIVLSGVTGGKATSVKAGASTILVKNGDQETTIANTGVDASGFDFAQVAHVVGTVRTDDSEPLRGIYDSVSVDNVKISDAKKGWAFTIANVKETGVRGRPLKTDFIKNPPKDKLTDEQSNALFKDLSRSFAVGTIEFTNVTGHAAQEDKGSFTLASLSMRDLGEGKFGGFGFKDLRFNSPEAKVGIASLNAGPFQLPQEGVPAAPQATSIDFNAIDVETTSPKAHVALAHLGLGGEGAAGDIPSTAKLAVDNLTFDLTPDMAQAQPLMDMGYKRLDLSAGLASTYDGGKQTLTIKDLTFNGVDMGNLALGLGLSNVSKNIVSSNTELAKASMLAILVQSLNFDLKNSGLIDRALAWKAKTDNMPVDQLKTNLAAMAETQIPAAAKNHPSAKLVADAIAKFIKDPKTLHISVVAKTGLGAASMGMMDDPTVLLDTLDVKASANQ